MKASGRLDKDDCGPLGRIRGDVGFLGGFGVAGATNNARFKRRARFSKALSMNGSTFWK